MNLIGTALAGIYVVATTRSASANSGQPPGSAEAGAINIDCEAAQSTNTTVSQPDMTVRVTCPDTSDAAQASDTAEGHLYFDANCSKSGELSTVCPGATVQTTQQADTNETEEGEKASKPKTMVTLEFPQLPASQQVICVKCPAKSRTESNKECKAVITVAAAPPQGPQACAVGGSSITLEISKAGRSAQFKCGADRTLAPTEPTKAYADDCSKAETLKDMTRSKGPKEGYVTVTVAKLKKKKLCYLCHPSAPASKESRGQDNPCKVYVQVSGSTKFSSTVPYGLALQCLVAMLRFT